MNDPAAALERLVLEALRNPPDHPWPFRAAPTSRRSTSAIDPEPEPTPVEILDLRTTDTDDPSTIPADITRTTDTDDPSSILARALTSPPDLAPGYPDFGTGFEFDLADGESKVVRIPLEYESEPGTMSRPGAVLLHVDAAHLDLLAITAERVLGTTDVREQSIDLKATARVRPVGRQVGILIDVKPNAPLPIDIRLAADGGSLNIHGAAIPLIGPSPRAQPVPPWSICDLGRSIAVVGPGPGQMEVVPASEADLPAGLAPSPSEGDREIRLILVGASKAALHKLIEGMDDRNAARVLSQVGKTALDMRKTLTRFGDHAFPEEEVLTKRERRRRRMTMGMGGGLSGSMNRETMGVTAIKEMIGAFTSYTRPGELKATIDSLAKLKAIPNENGELDTAISKLQAKVISMTEQVAADPGVDPEKALVAVSMAMTGTIGPDAWEGGNIGLGLGDSSMDDDDEDYLDDDDYESDYGAVGFLPGVPYTVGDFTSA